LEKYVLQHKQIYTPTSQIVVLQYCTNICCNDPELPLQHSKIIYCNILKNPLQHEQQKNIQTAPSSSPLSSLQEGGNRTIELTRTLATTVSFRSRGKKGGTLRFREGVGDGSKSEKDRHASSEPSRSSSSLWREGGRERSRTGQQRANARVWRPSRGRK